MAKDNAPLMKVLYDGPMIQFYERLLGGPVRRYDFTWMRVKGSGDKSATQPHCDIVYIGRGTTNI